MELAARHDDTREDPIRRNRLRFLVREVAGGHEAIEAFRTSFGMKDLEELSDRVTQQLAQKQGLSDEELYDKLLWNHLVHLALSRIPRRRREEVKANHAIDSDEALGVRVVEDLMRDKGLSAELAHEYLLEVTLPDRCVEGMLEILASTGVAAEEFDELLEAAGIADNDELRGRVTEALRRIQSVPRQRRDSALTVAAIASPTELALLLVALEVRGHCPDSGARQANDRTLAIRARLEGSA